MKVVFSDRAFAAIMAETTEKIKTETGGLFLGSFEDGIWYVIEAIDPGPKSIFEVAYFEYDQQYTQHLINKIANLLVSGKERMQEKFSTIFQAEICLATSVLLEMVEIFPHVLKQITIFIQIKKIQKA